MSAYIVDKNHVVYLVSMAVHRAITHGSDFVVYLDDETQPYGVRPLKIAPYDFNAQAAMATKLWQQNAKSVNARYRESSEIERFVVKPSEFGKFYEFDAIQLLKSINCLEYQSCEHGGWKKSEARTFLKALESRAILALPGYDAAKWGAPEPRNGMVMLSRLRPKWNGWTIKSC